MLKLKDDDRAKVIAWLEGKKKDVRCRPMTEFSRVLLESEYDQLIAELI